jgi:hypothetical protein
VGGISIGHVFIVSQVHRARKSPPLPGGVVFGASNTSSAHNELVAGDYGLTVTRDSHAEPMFDTSRLHAPRPKCSP